MKYLKKVLYRIITPKRYSIFYKTLKKLKKVMRMKIIRVSNLRDG